MSVGAARRRRSRWRKLRLWVASRRGRSLVLTLSLAAALGLLIFGQLRHVARARARTSDIVDQLAYYNELITEQQQRNSQLQDENRQLSEERVALITALLSRATAQDEKTREQIAQLERNRRLAQATAVTGPGVELILGDATGVETASRGAEDIIHELDIQIAVNLLKANGASAMAVNGERLISTSKLICNGPTILVNRSLKTAPFVITATGDVEAMMAALNQDSRLVYLMVTGKEVHIRRLDEVTIPAFSDQVYIRTVTDKLIERKQP